MMNETVFSRAKFFVSSEEGPTTVEYAVMLALIVGVVIAVVGTLGTKTNDALAGFNSKFTP